MKKTTLFLLALMACNLTFAEIIKRGNLYYELYTTTAAVVQDQNKIDGKNYSTLDTVVIPSTITYDSKTYTITTINTDAFSYATTLRSVTIPSTVTAIRNYAFDGCNGITEIVMPEELTTIGNYTFRGCARIDSIVIPKFVTSVGNYAFDGCSGLKHIVWKAVNCSSPSAYNVRPFVNCTGVETFTFGEEVKAVPAYLCYDKSKLTEIVLPNSVTSIGSCAFEGCSKLESLTLPSGLTYISGSMCQGCSSLAAIEIPATVTQIAGYAFDGCAALTSIELPELLTTIGNYTFRGCKLVTQITIPEKVSSIGNYAFDGCSGLKEVVWNAASCSSPSAYNVRPFVNCINIENFTFGEEVKTVPAYLCYDKSKLTEIVLPNSVTSIGSSAFSGCSKLESLTLPSGLTYIPGSMCQGCSSLAAIEIPATVTQIAGYAFDDCRALQQVILPATLTTIGNYAFRGCQALNILYNYALTPQTVNANVFDNVDKSACYLYVPEQSLDLYAGKAVWNGFANIIGMKGGLVIEDKKSTITYLDEPGDTLHTEPLLLHVPVAPKIDGYKFLKWEILAGDLEDGILLQAVYETEEPTGNPAPAAQENSGKASKLIRRGNVFILRDDALFTITGTKVH